MSDEKKYTEADLRAHLQKYKGGQEWEDWTYPKSKYGQLHGITSCLQNGDQDSVDDYLHWDVGHQMSYILGWFAETMDQYKFAWTVMYHSQDDKGRKEGQDWSWTDPFSQHEYFKEETIDWAKEVLATWAGEYYEPNPDVIDRDAPDFLKPILKDRMERGVWGMHDQLQTGDGDFVSEESDE